MDYAKILRKRTQLEFMLDSDKLAESREPSLPFPAPSSTSSLLKNCKAANDVPSSVSGVLQPRSLAARSNLQKKKNKKIKPFSKISRKNNKKKRKQRRDPPFPSDVTEGVHPDDLNALPPPPPPNTGKCQWTWDEESRVFLGDFTVRDSTRDVELFQIHPDYKSFLVQVMERDDMTLDKIVATAEPAVHYRFRRFDQILSEDGQV